MPERGNRHPQTSGPRPGSGDGALSTPITRRRLLVAGGAGAGLMAAGGLLSACGKSTSAGPRADITLRAMRSEVDLGGGRMAKTWTYGGELPGTEVRLRQGRPVRIRLENDLDEPTSVHWHGIRLRNAADGVPGMTQKAVAPGESFLYEFTPPDAGTYMLHSHVGTQLDRGLYAPLIVEPRSETLDFDAEAVVMFDDWLDGVAGTPAAKLRELRRNGMQMGGSGSAGSTGGMDMGGGSGSAGSMGGMDMGGGSMGGANPMGRMRHAALDGRAPKAGSLARLANDLEAGRLDPGDVRDYPLYLVNGRSAKDPWQVKVRRGDRVRLRLINPSADTIFCAFVEGHELEVVRADGVAVKPVRTDALMLGMGERYDVIVRARGDGVARIVGMPLGKRGRAVGLMRYAGSNARAPGPGAPLELPKRVLSYEDLAPAEQPGTPLPSGSPRVIRLDLNMGMDRYEWTIGGQAFPKAKPVRVARGEHVRFVMRNRTMMPHPMHLHGHNFAVGGRGGPLKDTALAVPMRELTLDWVADNPGTWAYHCHNVYHQEAGMMRRVVVA